MAGSSRVASQDKEVDEFRSSATEFIVGAHRLVGYLGCDDQDSAKVLKYTHRSLLKHYSSPGTEETGSACDSRKGIAKKSKGISM